jgi:large subunit ribosomal protein L9
MAVEILLMAKVDGLGIEGDIVRVADGYARNFLFPKGLAAVVTEGKKRQIEKARQERLAEMAKEIDAAKELAAKLKELSVTIAVKTTEGGKLFGSVDAAHIADKVNELGFALDKELFILAEPIKEIGFFDVALKLHPEVQAVVKVSVVDENE